MRRQNELIVGSQQHPSANSTAPAGATASVTPPPEPAQGLSLVPTSAAGTSQDSLNTPTTPLLGLSRNPLQFAPPPAPPIAVPSAATSGPTFGYYQSSSAATLHHPAAATTENGGAASTTELDEYVDILQVQQLLLDSSAAAAAAANNPPATTEQQQQQQPPQQIVAKPRPRINLQKATEYAAQLAQGKDLRLPFKSPPISQYLNPPAESSSPGSRRVLLDYPNPYLYGNPYHHHTPPSEDLVALWFGSNGTGESGPK